MVLSDQIGEQITKYGYDVFGNLFRHMAAPCNAVGFTGNSYNAKASLIDYSARWYSPNELLNKLVTRKFITVGRGLGGLGPKKQVVGVGMIGGAVLGASLGATRAAPSAYPRHWMGKAYVKAKKVTRKYWRW
jgi:hypothetical protein